MTKALVSFLILIPLTIFIVYLCAENKAEKEREIRVERSKKIDDFFSRFDKFSDTPYISDLDMIEIMSRDKSIHSIKEGDLFIIEIGLCFEYDETNSKYVSSILNNFNKISILVKNLDNKKTIASRDDHYIFCSVKDVKRSYDGGCHVILDGLLMFTGGDIVKNPKRMYDILTLSRKIYSNVK
jgi:hypothetical protein